MSRPDYAAFPRVDPARDGDRLLPCPAPESDAIYRTPDGKADFYHMTGQTLVHVRTGGQTALYPWTQPSYRPRATAVLMDLDGTSVHSEAFWMWIIERTMAELLDDASFRLARDDEPFVSGFSVSEHLQYCIDKYHTGEPSTALLPEARRLYHAVTEREMREVAEGRGRSDAFAPAPGLKEFLLALRRERVKIALITSGLYAKAMPEIAAAFRQLDMGDPEAFYDCIITAGQPLGRGKAGTLGELCAKPHPWLYAEAARVGLGLSEGEAVIGMEDSSAGVLAVRLAGYPVIGVGGGNIEKSGYTPLLYKEVSTLTDALPHILG